MSENGDSSKSDDRAYPPPHPGAWIACGVGIGILGAVLYFVSGDASDAAAVAGLVVLAAGAIVSTIGSIALAVLIAIRLHDWDRTH